MPYAIFLFCLLLHHRRVSNRQLAGRRVHGLGACTLFQGPVVMAWVALSAVMPRVSLTLISTSTLPPTAASLTMLRKLRSGLWQTSHLVELVGICRTQAHMLYGLLLHRSPLKTGCSARSRETLYKSSFDLATATCTCIIDTSHSRLPDIQTKPRAWFQLHL
jgi:hypothetical protein